MVYCGEWCTVVSGQWCTHEHKVAYLLQAGVINSMLSNDNDQKLQLGTFYPLPYTHYYRGWVAIETTSPTDVVPGRMVS